MVLTLKKSIEINYQVIKYNNIKISDEISKEFPDNLTKDEIKEKLTEISSLILSSIRADLEKICMRYWNVLPEENGKIQMEKASNE
ncbi:MAG: hypothetical protein WC934_11810 [Acidithiobacillus sp.]|jgi:hypothetical protein|uniref:hypothetical protein n=1 Tax=Acidithiobacillus sp. TaxID=1872118 RepID=UPI00355EA214